MTLMVDQGHWRWHNLIGHISFSNVSVLCLGNANPEVIFQTRVYGFDRIQTRVPGYPGLTLWWVTCQWQTHKSCIINSYATVRWKYGWLYIPRRFETKRTGTTETSVETTPHKHYEFELGNATRVPENPGNPPVF